jgi:hypothetical protein
VLSDSPQSIEHGTTSTGRWLESRRIRLAVWIAAAEALIVLVSSDITKWTVIVFAVAAVLAWLAARDSRSHLLRQVLWILAVSQLLAVVAVSLGWIVKWALITAAIAFAVVGIGYLFVDRRR